MCKVIIGQLKLAIKFMKETPGGNSDVPWWEWDMPAFPDEYVAEEWSPEAVPIVTVWHNFILMVDKECPARAEEACRLEINDLLDESLAAIADEHDKEGAAEAIRLTQPIYERANKE